ncbi:NO-inducible flavohemoprotein [Halalkalibacter krulwichiae]|uniref:Flavohemoprotein n=1 Tax=Halalkalibacter krulwichiae TaxID=199441 RepID=A0A1X9MA87_9BACI|nr:NO-inducible flavohemoprotein [Halalkalibacter krulwichiae]ARK29510.1 Flavohemoprotein [Halalkalibacter krulwichiae]
MLSNKTIEIVKATAPVLEVKGKEITTNFYKSMFAAHPELLNVFNHANQQKGRQQTALANTVTAAAHYIDRLEVLVPVVKQIAHKHRSLAVKAEHYPIVGEFLLKAIKEVLGDAATEEILEAWGEAYHEIAAIFIQVEKEMYEEAERQENGWKDFKTFKIVKKAKESGNITSFYLAPVDGKKLPSFKPGQYITVRVKINGEEFLQNRQYSLSDVPNDEAFRISVKREDEQTPAGKVSNFLHEAPNGLEVEVSPPAGDFILEEDEKPVYFLAGGVGITPLLSMLKTSVTSQPNRKVTFIHAARNSDVLAFEVEVKEAIKVTKEGKSYLCYSNPTNKDLKLRNFDHEGYVDRAFLEEIVEEKDAHFYVCGPVPFLQTVVNELKQLEVKEENIHYEFFGPAMKLEEATTV